MSRTDFPAIHPSRMGINGGGRLKSWTCDDCGLTCNRKFNIERHLKVTGHRLSDAVTARASTATDLENAQSLPPYECTTCKYTTNVKSNYLKHTRSFKHAMLERLQESKKEVSEAVHHAVEEVKHQIAEDAKKSAVAAAAASASPVHLHEVMEMFLKFSSDERTERIQNTEMFKSLVDRVLACQQQQVIPSTTHAVQQNVVLENMTHSQNTTTNHNTNTNNNNSKHFNLNFYLNEECKNAMNMSDFIKNVVISMEDLEHLSEVGYTEGMQRILTKALQEKEKTERPMHCSDVKREVIYVRKDDAWLKDDTKEETEHFIRHIYHKNLKMMKEWCDEHPDHQISDSPDYEYWYSITRTMCNTNPNAMKKLVSHLAQVTAIEKSSSPS